VGGAHVLIPQEEKQTVGAGDGPGRFTEGPRQFRFWGLRRGSGSRIERHSRDPGYMPSVHMAARLGSRGGRAVLGRLFGLAASFLFSFGFVGKRLSPRPTWTTLARYSLILSVCVCYLRARDALRIHDRLLCSAEGIIYPYSLFLSGRVRGRLCDPAR
jgi:hypothetical protein